MNRVVGCPTGRGCTALGDEGNTVEDMGDHIREGAVLTSVET